MLRTRTAFIVGAGASVAYGLPTGNSLRRLLIDNSSSRQPLPLLRMAGLPDERIDYLEHLSHDLRASVCGSIDEFLQTRDDHAPNLKRIVAAVLLHKEYASITNWPLDDDWIGWLFSHVFDESTWSFSERASFVVFNYDRLIALGFRTILRTRFRRDQASVDAAMQTLRIVHVYGQLGTIKPASPDHRYVIDGPSVWDVSRAADGIKLMGERATEELATQAWSLIDQSQVVVCLGFYGHKSNIDLLNKRADDRGLLVGKRTYSTGYDMTTTERHRVMKRAYRNTSYPGELSNVTWGEDREGCLAFLRRTASFID